MNTKNNHQQNVSSASEESSYEEGNEFNSVKNQTKPKNT